MLDIPKEAWAQLDEYPLITPPQDVVADVQNRVWHGAPVVIAGAIGIPAMIIMAAIRVYIKCYSGGRWNLDDSVFLFSLICGISLGVLQIAVITGGAYGFHAWDVQIKDLTKPVLLRSIALLVANPLLTWAIKLAVYSLLFTAFRPLAYVRYMVYLGVVVSFGVSFTAAVINGIACGPRGGTDRLDYLAGMVRPQCASGLIQSFSTVSGVLRLVNDFYLLILPLPACYKLRIPWKQKVGVMLIFLAGAGACAMSILGLIYRPYTPQHDKDGIWAQDPTYLQVPLFVVFTVEYSVCVIIPCMAPFAKFCKHMATAIRLYLPTHYSEHASSPLEDHQLGIVPNNKLCKDPRLQTDTIDVMLARMFPGELDPTESTVERNQETDRDTSVTASDCSF